MTCTRVNMACIPFGGQGFVFVHQKDKPFDVIVDSIGEEVEKKRCTVLGPEGPMPTSATNEQPELALRSCKPMAAHLLWL